MFRDAQATASSQAEQAAFYLAASAVVSQNTGVANVAPITFDQPATDEAEGESNWWNPSQEELDQLSRSNPGWTAVVMPVFGMVMMPDGSMECRQVGTSLGWMWSGDLCTLVQPTDDGTSSSLPTADDSGSSPDIRSVDPVSPETPSGESNDADTVGGVPSKEQPAGGDDVAAEGFPAVVDDTLVAGDEVADPVGEDTGRPDPSDTEEVPWCGSDSEDLAPIDDVDADVEVPYADGSEEIALDTVPAETQVES